jgi:hypothetical protein
MVRVRELPIHMPILPMPMPMAIPMPPLLSLLSLSERSIDARSVRSGEGEE